MARHHFSRDLEQPKQLNSRMLGTRTAAKIDALRVTLRTVPGTVPGVVLGGMSDAVVGTIAQAICDANRNANWPAYRRGTDRFAGRVTLTITRWPTSMVTAAATWKVTCGRTWTAICETRPKVTLGSRSPRAIGGQAIGEPLKVRAPLEPRRRGRRNQPPR